MPCLLHSGNAILPSSRGPLRLLSSPLLPHPALPRSRHPPIQACLHLFVTISICANLMCTASTTFVSVWGSGKALRGKDGSMDKAVEGMLAERGFIFTCFGVGACLHCHPRARTDDTHIDPCTCTHAHNALAQHAHPYSRTHSTTCGCTHAHASHTHCRPRRHIFPLTPPPPPTAGLITTLLALMSASWILMTVEVAAVATLGISWAIYVICRQASPDRTPLHLPRSPSL